MKSYGMSLLATASLLSGCGTYTPREVAEPSNVTLRKAVFEVAETLRDVRDVTPPGKKSGLMADEVTVTFNIAASSVTTNKADLTVSNIPVGKGASEASFGTQNVSDGSRGNQIIIKFKNIATADMSKGIYNLKQFQGGSSLRPDKKPEPETGNADKPGKEPAVPKPDGSPPARAENPAPAEVAEMCRRSGLCTMNKRPEMKRE